MKRLAYTCTCTSLMMSVSRENSFCCTWVFFLSICNTMLNWLFFLFCFCFYFVCANIIYIRMITFDRKDVVGVFWSDKSKNCLLLVDGSRGRLLGKKEDIYDVVWEKKIKCVLEKKIIDDYVVFYRFRREILALQSENYALEKQLYSYQKSIARTHSRGQSESEDYPPDRNHYHRWNFRNTTTSRKSFQYSIVQHQMDSPVSVQASSARRGRQSNGNW